MHISKVLSLFLISLSMSASAQKLVLYNKLDSFSNVQKQKLSTLKASGASQHVTDSVKSLYQDVRDSLREEAHDKADSLIEHMDNSSHFELATDFASRQLYTGRRGPASDVVFSPSLKYQHKTGIYAQFGTDEYKLKYSQLTLRKVSRLRYDTVTVNVDKIESDITLTAGFARTFYNLWDFDTYIDHTFIFYGQDKNYLASSFNINNSIDFWSYIKLDIYYTLLFGGSNKTPANEKKYSNILSFQLAHDFKIYRFLGSKVFTISPEALIDIGNDNFTRGRLRSKLDNGGVSAKTASDNFFGLLNVEGSLNIDYRIKNLDIFVDPRVAIPFNVVPTNALSTAPYRNNTTNSPLFYVNAGIKYLFRFWKEQTAKKPVAL